MTAEFNPNSNAPILALDLGKFNSMCCFFDPQTEQARFQTVPTDRGYLRSFLSAQNVNLVVFEACGPSGWLHDLRADSRRPEDPAQESGHRPGPQAGRGGLGHDARRNRLGHRAVAAGM